MKTEEFIRKGMTGSIWGADIIVSNQVLANSVILNKRAKRKIIGESFMVHGAGFKSMKVICWDSNIKKYVCEIQYPYTRLVNMSYYKIKKYWTYVF
jgi:hypothetical protein